MATDVPLDQPFYDAPFTQAVRRFWAKYAVFSGRAGRAEYWWWVLAAAGVSLVVETVRFLLLGASLSAYVATPIWTLRWSSLPSVLWFLVSFVPTQALAVRRLHDAGHRGWWQLLSLVVLAGSVVQTHYLPTRVSLTTPPPPLTGTPLVATTVGSVAGLVTQVVLIVLLTAAPVAAGRRFDRRRPEPDGLAA